jgi:phage portal protein BeeE
MSLDGIHGLSPISYHRETIGLAIAAQKYGAAFFGNSAQPRGAIKVPTVLSAEAAAAARFLGSEAPRRREFEQDRDLRRRHGIRPDRHEQHRRAVSRNAQDAERRDLAHLPDAAAQGRRSGKATFSNIEQQSLEYVTDCLMSELVRWEQTLKRDLLLERRAGRILLRIPCRRASARRLQEPHGRLRHRAQLGPFSAPMTAATART